MSLRVIGGAFKNRALKSPKGEFARPTTALMRKAVFDICQEAVLEAHFLDLFACSGAMGIEALSRGAATATFVEKDSKAIACLIENLRSLQIESQATILSGDVTIQLKKLALQPRQFDIVYIDPPYALAKSPQKPLQTILSFFDESSLLHSGSILFLEEAYPSSSQVETVPFSHLRLKGTRKYGNSCLHEFRIP